MIGSAGGFCKNLGAMREEWRRYWGEFGRYKYFPLWGFLISLVPFLLGYTEYRRRDALWTGLLISVNFTLTITFAIWVLFAGVYAILVVIRIRTGLTLKRPFLFQAAVGLVGTITGVWLGMVVNSLVLGLRISGSAILPGFVFSGLVTVMFALILAYRQAKEDALRLQATAAESKYNVLEHQMRPHFLFNALNSLAELIESGHERAAEMTYRLSDLYRLILANSKVKTAPLETELDIARRYLELEQLRFGARLSFVIEVADDAREIYVPSLMIQTLIENAVKHGISKSVTGGSIEIKVSAVAANLYQLQVENTGEPFVEKETAGTGLVNTRARLDLLYGNKHQFSVRGNGDGKTVARFCFTGEQLD